MAQKRGGLITITSSTGTPTLSLNITGSGNQTYSGLLSGGLALTVNSSGTGAQILSGANNTYSGATTVNAGTLRLNDTPTVSALPSGGALTLGGGTLSEQGSSITTAVTQTVGTFALTANTSSAIVLGDTGSVTGTSLTSTNTTFAPANGTTLYLNRANGGNLTLGTTAPATFSPWAVVTDSTGTGFGSINASSQLVRDTPTAVLTASSNSGSTDFTTNPATDGYAGGTLTLSAGAHATDSLFITAAAPSTLALNGQTLSFTSNALGMSGGSNYTISGSGQLGASAASLTINQVGTGTLTINSLISGTTGTLTKAGSGGVVLGGANTYTGITTVSGGTLAISADANLGAGPASFTANQLTVNGGALAASATLT